MSKTTGKGKLQIVRRAQGVQAVREALAAHGQALRRLEAFERNTDACSRSEAARLWKPSCSTRMGARARAGYHQRQARRSTVVRLRAAARGPAEKLRAVLAKYGYLDWLCETLLRKHFAVGADEVLVEYPDPVNRPLVSHVEKHQSVDPAYNGAVSTTL